MRSNRSFLRLASAGLVCLLLASAARADDARTLTPADKKEMERILREFVDADDAKRKDLVQAAGAYVQISAKDFQPFADKLIKLRRRYTLPKCPNDRQTLKLADGVTNWTYMAKTPGGYTPGKPVPVFIFMHGVKGYDMAPEWLNAAAGAGYLSITPLTPSQWWDRGDTDGLLFETLRTLRHQFSIDPNRTFVAGFNEGGAGVWYYALRFPQFFAGAAPMASTIRPGNDGFDSAVNVPIFCWHGEKDEEFAPDAEKAACDALTALGGKAVIKIAPGGLVNDWYVKDLSAIQKEVFAKFAPLKRNPAPDKVVWARHALTKPVLPVPFPWPDGMYWIEVPLADKTAKVTAEKTGKGKFKITTEKARTVTLLLNPALADLNAPVEVEVDGKPAFSGIALCSLRTLLRTWEKFEDPDLTYFAEVELKAGK